MANLSWDPGKRSFGRLRRRWEVKIHMGLREIYYEDEIWTELAQDCVQWCAMVCFHISGVEYSTSAATVLVSMKFYFINSMSLLTQGLCVSFIFSSFEFQII